MTTPDPECRCGRMSIGESRNWNPDCPEHGTTSAWWNSPEQKVKRQDQSDRLRDLQRRAAEARRAARK